MIHAGDRNNELSYNGPWPYYNCMHTSHNIIPVICINSCEYGNKMITYIIVY